MGRSRALPFLSCSSTPTFSAANQTTTERSGDVIFNGAPIVLQVLFRTISFLTEPNNERKKCALTEFRRFGFSRPRTITTGLALKYGAVRQIYLGTSTTKMVVRRNYFHEKAPTGGPIGASIFILKGGGRGQTSPLRRLSSLGNAPPITRSASSLKEPVQLPCPSSRYQSGENAVQAVSSPNGDGGFPLFKLKGLEP